MEYKKPKKEPVKPKKKSYNPEVIPFQAKVHASNHRTLRGVRK